MPAYPNLARLARIEGTARIKVSTDGNSIVRIAADGAHKMLLGAAQENLKTWRFYPHKPQTFTVTFTFKLEPPEVYGPVNPTIQLDLPTRVEIRTKMPTVETVTTDKPE
jgi:TonB family protein